MLKKYRLHIPVPLFPLIVLLIAVQPSLVAAHDHDDETAGTELTAAASTGETGGDNTNELDGTPQGFQREGLEPKDGYSRARLVTGQSLHGVALGVQACVIVGCDSARPRVALPTLGAGAGFGLSMWATSDRGVTRGHSSAINYGTLWGAWTGFNLLQISDGDNTEAAMAILMTSQLAGAGVGHLLARSQHLLSGDVRLVNAGAKWSLLYYALVTYGILDVDSPSDQQLAVEMLTVSGLGGLYGALVARRTPMSRGRVRLINASGIAGMLLGGFFAVSTDTSNEAAVVTLLFTTGGLAAGTALSSDWDNDLFEQSSLSLAPTSEFDGVQAVISGRF